MSEIECLMSTAAFTVAAVKKVANDFALKEALPLLKSVLGKAYSQLEVRHKAVSYTERLVNRVAFSKTFLHTDRPRHLRRFYVPLQFMGAHSTISDDLASVRSVGRCVAIIGQAGTGKSTTLKHLCLEAIESGGIVPIFIELRRLSNRANDQFRPVNLRDAICREVFGDSLTKFETQVELLLKSDRLMIFLDGFDEVPKSFRTVLLNDFYTLQERHPHIKWILSSRPDSAINTLGPVHALRPLDLTLDQIRIAIGRFDSGNRRLEEEFLQLVETRLFQEHPSYARNPLLLSVLFITFRTHQRISERQSIFFREVFEALCQKHDQRKEGFERELATKLEFDQFIKCVELFAFQTSVQSQLYFSRMALRDTVRTVLNAYELDVSIDSFIEDLCQSISLLAEEGIEYTYVHKSLQEFLAARFIHKISNGKQAKALAKVAPDPQQSLVISILNELDPDLIENNLVLPLLAQFSTYESYQSIELYLEDASTWPAARRAIRVFRMPAEWKNMDNPFITGPDLLSLLTRLYPSLRFPPTDPSVWWMHKGERLTGKEFIAAGKKWFEEHGNVGELSTSMGIDFNAVSALKALEQRILVEQGRRRRLDRSVSELVKELVD